MARFLLGSFDFSHFDYRKQPKVKSLHNYWRSPFHDAGYISLSWRSGDTNFCLSTDSTFRSNIPNVVSSLDISSDDNLCLSVQGYSVAHFIDDNTRFVQSEFFFPLYSDCGYYICLTNKKLDLYYVSEISQKEK